MLLAEVCASNSISEDSLTRHFPHLCFETDNLIANDCEKILNYCPEKLYRATVAKTDEEENVGVHRITDSRHHKTVSKHC